MPGPRSASLRRMLLLLLCAVLPACPPTGDEAGCSADLVRIAISENIDLYASVVHRRCWVGTVSSHAVYLKRLRPDSREEEGWGEKVYVLRGSATLQVTWTSGQLVIKAPALGGDVLFRKDSWEGIAIVYQWDDEDAAWSPRAPTGLSRRGTGPIAPPGQPDAHPPSHPAGG